MFTSFRQGADAVEQWDDTPSYIPGRFHAHALPSPISTAGLPSSASSSSLSSMRARSPPPLLAPIAQHRSKLSNSISPNSSDPSIPSTKRGRLIAALGGPPARFTSPPPIASISRAPGSGSLPSDPLLVAHPSSSTTGRNRVTGRLLQDPAVLSVDPTSFGRPRPAFLSPSPSPFPPQLEPDETSWLLLRPDRQRVEAWLEYWWKRWAVLVLFPCAFVWVWCAMPFPVSDPYKEEPPWNLPWPDQPFPPRNTSGSMREIENVIGKGSERMLALIRKEQVERRNRGSERREFVELEFVEQPSIDEAVLSKGKARTASKTEPIYHAVDAETAKIKENAAIPNDQPSKPGERGDAELPVDANFYFFLFVYYGLYLAVALIFVTKLFDLYRLNWWPSSLGGSFSYLFFWGLSLLIGFLLHHWDLDGLGRRSHQRPGQPPSGSDAWDWERKTTWVALAFFCMTLPALACFIKLRADRRQTYRRNLTLAQKTFLERQLYQRMPRSYRRFLWFLVTLTISLFALIIGQGFATIYLSTLPHSNVDGLVYVWTWIVTVQILNAASNFILQRKVRSRALVFVFRYYYFLVYHVFYRSLFARLRSPDQAVFIQLLSSSFVILWYPLSMCRPFHSLLKIVTGLAQEYEEYAEDVGTMLYLRNLSENVTMVAFLGWLTILHFGPNKQIYPYFSFESPVDPYTYELTATASLIIWATELGSSFIARQVIWVIYGLDVTNLGLNAFREIPELVVACFWASIHVLMDMLLFLIKLNFR